MSSYRANNAIRNLRIANNAKIRVAKLVAENNAKLELRRYPSLEVESSFSTQYVDRFDGFHDNDWNPPLRGVSRIIQVLRS